MTHVTPASAVALHGTPLHKFVISTCLHGNLFCLYDLMRTGGKGSATHLAKSGWTKRVVITRYMDLGYRLWTVGLLPCQRRRRGRALAAAAAGCA